MNTSILSGSRFQSAVATLKLLWKRPSRQQIGALCYRFKDEELQVLMITTRETRRWILPKGWPMTRYSARKTAEREAFEEAGIIGRAGSKPIGKFASYKGLGNGFRVPTTVTVFPLLVTDQSPKFPESGERDLAWLSLDEAVNRTDEPGLRDFLQSDVVAKLAAR